MPQAILHAYFCTVTLTCLVWMRHLTGISRKSAPKCEVCQSNRECEGASETLEIL